MLETKLLEAKLSYVRVGGSLAAFSSRRLDDPQKARCFFVFASGGGPCEGVGQSQSYRVGREECNGPGPGEARAPSSPVRMSNPYSY